MNQTIYPIHPLRRSVPTPPDLIDKNGQCVFGTFESEFKTMDLLSTKKPSHLPDFLNKYKLTLWQASEISLDEGILLAVVCDMGIFGKIFHVFYDKRTGKVFTFDDNLPSSRTLIAPCLLKGAKSHASCKSNEITYTNLLERGRYKIEGRHEKDGHTIEYSFRLKRLSKPSVVSIPFGKNRPLYSQKDFLKAEGYLKLDDETFHSNERTTGVLDDHRGYYPRKSHYDWVMTQTVTDQNGKPEFFAFNLTRNQSIDQDAYNENLIWLESETSLLTPVYFRRTPETRDFNGSALWEIFDEHDMVNIRFHVDAVSAMVVHAGIVNIDYYIAFGKLEGYIRKEDGNKYILDGMTGMGEDKTLLL